MKKVANDLLKKYKMLHKWEKKVLIWYVVSVILIVAEYLINHQLDSNLFFHHTFLFMITGIIIGLRFVLR